jgi:type I restriction enzyme, S subunit
MREWRKCKLNEIAAPYKKAIISGPFGSNISSKYFVNDGVPVIRGNNLSLQIGIKFIDKDFVFVTSEKANELGTWAEAGDLIFTAAGTIGQVGLLTGKEQYKKYIISNKQLRVTPDREKIDPLFAYYWFASPIMIENIINSDTGSTIPLINLSVLKSLPITLPPLPEQRAITSVLSSLDDKIDLLHRQNKTLEATAETMFRQWFVEEAKSDDMTTLGEFAFNVRQNVKIEELGEYANYVGLEHIPRKCMALSTWGTTDKLASNKSTFQKNDILFGKLRSYFHKVVFAPVNGVCSTDILVIRPKKEEWFSFCLCSFFSKEVVDHSDLGSEGTRMPRTNWDILANFQISKPSNKILKEFDSIVRPLTEKIYHNIFHIQKLEALRSALLPKLISGEIRVDF